MSHVSFGFYESTLWPASSRYRTIGTRFAHEVPRRYKPWAGARYQVRVGTFVKNTRARSNPCSLKMRFQAVLSMASCG